MQETRILMGMPITVTIADVGAAMDDINGVFSYFSFVDEKFSTYKITSEISRINRGELRESDYSTEMKTIFALAEETRSATDGYFDIMTPRGTYDPSGIVKGWAIHNAGALLDKRGYQNFFVDAGGDVEVRGNNPEGQPWRVGIRNPFNPSEIIKVVSLNDRGIATSGTYARGQHIYNPIEHKMSIEDIVSMTVVGPNVYEADRFATAAFAMGKRGIYFIEQLDTCEGYVIDGQGNATMTSGFHAYIH